VEHPSDFGKAWGAKGIQWARQPSGETTEASLQISLPIVGSLTIYIYIYTSYTTMTFNSNKSRTSDGDLSSWRIKVFAAPVQQLQAIALNESCHLVAQGTGPGSLAPCSTGLLQWLTMSCYRELKALLMFFP